MNAQTPASLAPSSQSHARLEQLIQHVMGNDPAEQTRCTTEIRKLLSVEKDPPVKGVVDSGVIPRFVELLETCNDNPALQFEVAWVLANIITCETGGEYTKVVVEAGTVPILVRLLEDSSNGDVQEQVIWGLGNIARESPRHRDLILHQSGAMRPLLGQVHQRAKVSLLRNVSWTLSTFCMGKLEPGLDTIRPALPVLAQLIFVADDEVLTNALWALRYISGGPDAYVQAVAEAGVFGRLVDLFHNQQPSLVELVLRTVANILSSGNDYRQQQIQEIVDSDALPCLFGFLSNPKKMDICKEACRVVSKITAGNSKQIQAVIGSNNMVPSLLRLLKNVHVWKEAAQTISNAASGGNSDQIQCLVQQGCIQSLCNLMTIRDDAKIVMIALEALENILKVAEEDAKQSGNHNGVVVLIAESDSLITTLEELRQHVNDDIYEKCIKILETYFQVEVEELTE